MLLSHAYQAAHGHHLGAVAGALLAAAVVTGGYFADRPATQPRVEVTVVEVVEAVGVADPATPATTPVVGTLETTGSAATPIGVTVPTADEIWAQCEAAGLLDACTAAGLH